MRAASHFTLNRRWGRHLGAGGRDTLDFRVELELRSDLARARRRRRGADVTPDRFGHDRKRDRRRRRRCPWRQCQQCHRGGGGNDSLTRRRIDGNGRAGAGHLRLTAPATAPIRLALDGKKCLPDVIGDLRFRHDKIDLARSSQCRDSATTPRLIVPAPLRPGGNSATGAARKVHIYGDIDGDGASIQHRRGRT